MTSPRSLAQRVLPLLVLVGSLVVATVMIARGPRQADAAANEAGAIPAQVTPLPAE